MQTTTSAAIKTCGNKACNVTNVTMSKCGVCKNIHYCSVACQHAAWPEHKQECKEICAKLAESAMHNSISEEIKTWIDTRGVHLLTILTHLLIEDACSKYNCNASDCVACIVLQRSDPTKKSAFTIIKASTIPITSRPPDSIAAIEKLKTIMNGNALEIFFLDEDSTAFNAFPLVFSFVPKTYTFPTLVKLIKRHEFGPLPIICNMSSLARFFVQHGC